MAVSVAEAGAAPSTDIVFVTQVPVADDFANALATFGNHGASLDDVPRGGDLYIRYADGSLKNLTRAAGYGSDTFQGASSIAVRDPAVHWSGTKVVFSMVIGGASRQYEISKFYWQLYEVTGLGKSETPVITKVSNQPTGYNNVMPTYGTDDRILFISDRPHNGDANLYPQRDEYESTHTNTGLWSLAPQSGDLFLLDHTPSGAFSPIVDSFGRVLYTRWDHMQRDQQSDDIDNYGGFNYSSEAPTSVPLPTKVELYPEARAAVQQTDPHLNLHTFNHFFPWQINEDGTEHETLNHVGRHELHGYFNKTFDNDPSLDEFGTSSGDANQSRIQNFFHLREDPLHRGVYFGIDCPEFGTHTAGQVISINGAPNVPADQMVVRYVTDRSTSSTSDNPGPSHSGLYRDPLPLSDGSIIVSHTVATRQDSNQGTSTNPLSRYDLRLKMLVPSGNVSVAGAALTPGITKSITYWSPDVLVSYSGPLWEIEPVELVARSIPPRRLPQLASPEQSVFQQAGVDVEDFKSYLRRNNLSLIISRNVTTRDARDSQQPFNLHVAGSATQTVGDGGKVYDIAHLQIFQGDLIRGYRDYSDNGPPTGPPQAGRRVLAQYLHDSISANVPDPTGPTGSVRLASDGSYAALVPARRALTWQLTDPAGAGVVRERYWLTFQPGEIRVCGSCHGVNSHDQAGKTAPQNAPQALRDLLDFWKQGPHTVRAKTPCDFDGDGKTDFAVVRDVVTRVSGKPRKKKPPVYQHQTTWYALYSATGSMESVPFGDLYLDLLTAADLDGDRKSELTAARSRVSAPITWYNRAPGSTAIQSQIWGLPGDVPVVGDFDGDRTEDRAIYRPSDGSWWLLRSGLGPISVSWGLAEDVPAPADFDGDGWTDIAIWRPSIGYWAVLQSSKAASKNSTDTIERQWGLAGDKPLAGDYDGDGKADLVVFRPSTQTWFVCSSTTGFDCSQGTGTQFGLPGDLPIKGDFDGDGTLDFAVYRPSNGNWYVRRSSDGQMSIRQWGLPGDLPICGG
ncbi:MAG: FG-GAP-like repeat-containing protein [Bdellovibrionota bacterium]